MKRVEQIIAQVNGPGVIAERIDYVIGLDLGQSADYTAASLIQVRPDRGEGRNAGRFGLRYLNRWPLKTSYPAIVRDVVELTRKPPLTPSRTTLVVDSTGVGRPVVDLLDESGIACEIVPVTITGGTVATRDVSGHWSVPKRELVSALQIALQSTELQIAKGLELAATLTQELQGFRVKISLSGHDSYGAGEDWRSAPHDDLVLSAALAVWWAARYRAEVALIC